MYNVLNDKYLFSANLSTCNYIPKVSVDAKVRLLNRLLAPRLSPAKLVQYDMLSYICGQCSLYLIVACANTTQSGSSALIPVSR